MQNFRSGQSLTPQWLAGPSTCKKELEFLDEQLKIWECRISTIRTSDGQRQTCLLYCLNWPLERTSHGQPSGPHSLFLYTQTSKSSCFFLFVLISFFRLRLTVWPHLVSNSQSSFLSLLSAGITGVFQDSRFSRFLVFSLLCVLCPIPLQDHLPSQASCFWIVSKDKEEDAFLFTAGFLPLLLLGSRRKDQVSTR